MKLLHLHIQIYNCVLNAYFSWLYLGVFIARGKEDALVTKNIVPGESVYGEKRISVDVRSPPLFVNLCFVQEWLFLYRT